MDILETVDEDGKGVQDIIDEDSLFRLLGLRTDEEQNERRRQGEAEPEFEGAGDRDSLGGNRNSDNAIDTSDAAIPLMIMYQGKDHMFMILTSLIWILGLFILTLRSLGLL